MYRIFCALRHRQNLCARFFFYARDISEFVIFASNCCLFVPSSSALSFLSYFFSLQSAFSSCIYLISLIISFFLSLFLCLCSHNIKYTDNNIEPPDIFINIYKFFGMKHEHISYLFANVDSHTKIV